MKLTVKNLTSSVISTYLGTLAPCEVKVFALTSEDVYTAGANLKSLEDAGKISTSVADEPVALNKYAAVTPANDILPTGDVVLYVDQATGLDTNDGSAARPFKTINAAVSMVPDKLDYNHTINIAAGTYAEMIYTHHSYGGNLTSINTKQLTFAGATPVAFTPATGVSSGTFTGNSGALLTMTAAGWTIDNLKTAMLKITSGTKSGNIYPICSNTATEIEVTGLASAVGNASFELVTPSTIITTYAGGAKSLMVRGNASRTFTNIKFTYSFSVINGSTATFTQCYTAMSSNTIGVSSYLSCTRCTMPAIASSFSGLSTTGPCIIYLTNCLLDGLGIATGSAVQTQQTGGGVTVSHVAFDTSVVQGWASSTAAAYRASGSLILSGARIQKNKIGVSAEYGVMSLELAAGAQITGNTSHGIYVKSHGGIRIGMPGNTGGCFITNNGGDGIRLDTPNNAVLLMNSANISGNTGFGINIGATVGAGCNVVRIGTTPTMGTNAAGDMTLDGTTAKTLVELTGAPAKTLTETTRFNRIVAD